jgi:energy-coupling factor transport system ATP-binding protein
MTALRFEDVWFGYGDTPVLHGVSLSLEEGETVALLGRNGAGKTTLTKLIVALLRPERGTVWVGERTTQGRSPEQVARRVAYVFQHPDQQLFARTVHAEVAFGPRQQGLDAAAAELVVREALRRVGLDAMREEHPYDLPAAQRKLVTLGAAIAQRPRVLVLDEPTQGLDRAGARRVMDVVRRMSEDGVTVLAVTHDLAFVAESLDRAVVLADGRIVFDGTAAELVRSEPRAMELGLEVPPAARLAQALKLPQAPVRVRDVAAALTARGRD